MQDDSTKNDSYESSENPHQKSLYTRRIIDIQKLNKILNRTSSHGLCGSYNLGNTCFMNSSIACLSNTIDLTTYFLTEEYKKDINKENERGMKGKLANEWYNLLYQCWVEHTRVVEPSNFKKIISKKAKRFKGFEQQDSNEFMTFFLDYLNEDLNKTTIAPYEEIEEQKDNEKDIECAQRFWKLNLKRNDSIITDLFSGQFKSTISCPDCKWISRTYDTFNSLILPIAKKSYKIKSINKIIFYIPKYSMRSTIKIMLNINRDLQFKDVANKLNQIKEFRESGYESKKLNFMDISEKKFKEFYDDDDILCKNKNFIFCSEEDEKYKTILPLYISSDNFRDLSAYPRMLYVNKTMSFDEFKMRIYFFARHYINNPFGLKNDEDEFKEMFDEYYKGKSNDVEKIISYMKKEYEEIFINKNKEKKDLIKKFEKDIPFSFLLKKGERIINILDKNIENIKLIDLGIQEEGEINVETIINLIKKGIFKLYLIFKKRSSYIEIESLKFNLCSTIKTPKYIENEHSNNYNITLEDCFEKFREEETLNKGNEWYCKKCKNFQKAKKKMELFYLPKILIICLKRFTIEGRYWDKNESFVDFPINNMDMKNFVCGPDNDNVKYDLFAVSQHFGSCYGGHYTAVCKNYDKWYEYNDSTIAYANKDDIVNSAAYVLFYRRQTD